MTGEPASYQERYWHSADGLTLYGRDYPAASGAARLPVVCLHGLTRNSRDFGSIAPWLAGRGRRVLALDMRGRGHSDRDPGEHYDIATYVADVVGWLDALGIARAVFVGTSMGGLITIELGTQHPDRVAGAVINDIGPELAMEGLVRIAGYVALDYDPAIARALARIVADPDPWGKWHGFADARPVLVLRGSRTDLLAQDVAERMVAGKARATLAPVAGVGHAPMLDEPDAVAAIERFLAGV
jgi:pimeloyl-ACP methyl ester carboxylesterase